MLATDQKQRFTVLALLEAQADPNARDGDGQFTALHLSEDVVISKALLEHGANVNAVAPRTLMTPLMIVAHRADLCLLLLSAKASVATRSFESSALHYAVSENAWDALRVLIKHSSPQVLCAQNKHGFSVLMEAAMSWPNNVEVAQVCTLLLNANADAAAKDNQGRTALQLAVVRNRTHAADGIRAWLKGRDAALAFMRGTRHARISHKKKYWTDSKLFDMHLIGEITAYIVPPSSL
jgi:ankyrin repeat protein